MRLAIVFALVSLSRLALAEGTKVAVLEIKSTGIEEMVTKNLSELFTAEAGRVPGYKVIGHQEIQDMVGFEIQKQTMGCNEASCFAELGGALGVDLIVSGSIGKVGETFVVSLRLIDIKRTETKNRVSESLAGRVELLPDYVRVAAWRLFNQPVPADVTAAYEATKTRLDKQDAPPPVQTAMAVQPAPAPAPAVAPAPAAAPLPAQPAEVSAKTPAKRPLIWRLGSSASGLLAVGGLLYGGLNHAIGHLKGKGEESAQDVPGFGADADALKSRAYLGYGVAAVGIAGAILIAVLEPEPTGVAARIVPTSTGLAFTF